MRYFFAILSLVIAAVLIILGIGQRTFLAGPTSVREDVPIVSDESQYVVIPAEVFAAHKGNPSVIVNGTDVFFAFAQQRDVLGWVEPFAYEAVHLGEPESLVTVSAVEPEPATPDEGDEDDGADVTHLDPRGSDLWLTEHEGETSLKIAVSLEDDQAVLVTSGEGEARPSEVYVLWAQERNTPLAGPLLATGGLFGALGAVLYLFALDHDRRGLGPRRGRKGPLQGLRNPRVGRQHSSRKPSGAGRGQRLGFIAGVGLSALVLTGCSPSYWPQPPAEPTPEPMVETEERSAVVPVKEEQLERILADVVSVVNAADEAQDASLLESRVSGPALEQRAANYTIRGSESSWRVLPHLTETRLSYELVQSTEGWPRTMFVTVESSDALPAETLEADDDASEEADETEAASATEVAEPADAQPETETTPTLALILTQLSPHENYRLSHVIELRGGIEMPAAAPPAEGTAVLANDIKTLLLTPKQAAENFATVLSEGIESEAAQDFALEGEHLVANMGAQWAANNCSEGMECSAEVSVHPSPIMTLSTGHGGALVLATFTDAHVMTVTGERNVVSLTTIEEALGLEGSYRSVKRIWQHDVLMYVPNADASGRIDILGSSSEIVDAIAESEAE